MDSQRWPNLVFLMSMSGVALGCPSDDDASDDGVNATTSGGSTGTPTVPQATTAATGDDSSGGSPGTTSGDTDGGSTAASGADSSTSAATAESGSGDSTGGDGICEAYATVQEMCGFISTYEEALAACMEELRGPKGACTMAFEEVVVCIGALSCREFDDPDSCSEEFEALANCAK